MPVCPSARRSSSDRIAQSGRLARNDHANAQRLYRIDAGSTNETLRSKDPGKNNSPFLGADASRLALLQIVHISGYDSLLAPRQTGCRSSLLIGAGTAGSCAQKKKKKKKKARSTCARQCRRHVDCGLDDRKQERSRLRAKRRAPLETALRSFPPLVAMVKATHSRQRHDLGRV